MRLIFFRDSTSITGFRPRQGTEAAQITFLERLPRPSAASKLFEAAQAFITDKKAPVLVGKPYTLGERGRIG
jgi:hypothetical protein